MRRRMRPGEELGFLAGLMGARRSPQTLIGALGIVGVVLLGSGSA